MKTSGKVDKAALRQVYMEHGNRIPYNGGKHELTNGMTRLASESSEDIRRILADLLGLPPNETGRPDDGENFFLLGGDSLLVSESVGICCWHVYMKINN